MTRLISNFEKPEMAEALTRIIFFPQRFLNNRTLISKRYSILHHNVSDKTYPTSGSVYKSANIAYGHILVYVKIGKIFFRIFTFRSLNPSYYFFKFLLFVFRMKTYNLVEFYNIFGPTNPNNLLILPMRHSGIFTGWIKRYSMIYAEFIEISRTYFNEIRISIANTDFIMSLFSSVTFFAKDRASFSIKETPHPSYLKRLARKCHTSILAQIAQVSNQKISEGEIIL